jgi:hypothetical protein
LPQLTAGDGLNTLRHLPGYRRAVTAGQQADGDGDNDHSAIPCLRPDPRREHIGRRLPHPP